VRIPAEKLNQVVVLGISPKHQILNQIRKSMSYSKQKLSVNETFMSIKLHHFIENKNFKFFIFMLVVLNIVVLIVGYSADETTYQSYICEVLQLVLTLIFVGEILMKITVYGLKSYFKDIHNIIDFLIILLNVFEIIYEISIEDNLFYPQTVSSPGIKSMKFLRLFRFITDLDHWKTGSMLFRETMTTLRKTLDFIIVILIFNLLASLYGMQIFAYTVRLDGENISHDLINGETPRLNYDTFLDAVMTTTLIFLDEEWHVIMFQYMRAFGSKAAIYFILVLICGSVMLTKMFIALFINYFLNSKSIQKLIYKAPLWDRFTEKFKRNFNYVVTSFPKVFLF